MNNFVKQLTHLSLAFFLRAKSVEPDQTLLNAESDQVLHYFLTKCSFKILMKLKLTTQQPLNLTWFGPFDKGGKFH